MGVPFSFWDGMSRQTKLFHEVCVHRILERKRAGERRSKLLARASNAKCSRRHLQDTRRKCDAGNLATNGAMKTSMLFLSAMREKHGISDEFLEAARPLVESIYAEFDGEQRANLLEFAESVVSEQAKTERSIRASTRSLREAASKLERSFARFTQAVESLRNSVTDVSALEVAPVPRWRLN